MAPLREEGTTGMGEADARYDVTLKLETVAGKAPDIGLTLRDGSRVHGQASEETLDRALGLGPRWVSGSLTTQDAWNRLTGTLGELLFPGSIKARLKEVRSQHGRLRLWLEITDEELRRLPWEAADAAFIDDRPMLCLSGVSVFRRSIHSQKELPAPAESLRVAFAIGARGSDRHDVATIAPARPVAADIDTLAGLDVEVLDDATPDQIATGLTTADVLHYSGHAVARPRGAGGAEQVLLVHPGEKGAPDTVAATELKPAGSAARTARMVVLAACQTGSVSGAHAGWPELDAEIVIAMQRDVTDAGARAFTRAFYVELSASGDLDLAVSAGRTLLHSMATKIGEATVPVVYSRYSGGPMRLLEATGSGRQPGGRGASSKQGPRRPLVRTRPAPPGTAIKVGDWLDDLRGALGEDASRRRPLTPFLGPGVLQIAPDQEVILWDAALEAACTEDPALGRFVGALLVARSRFRRVDTVEEGTPEDRSISEVRLAMARLAERASAAFTAAAATRAIPLNLWESFELEVDLASDEPGPQLTAAIQALERHRGEYEEHRLFGEERMVSRLRELQDGLGRRGKVSGSTIAWLTDLFWHTVVFESPLYPHASELGVQVSLLAGSHERPLQRLDPPSAVTRGTGGLRRLGEATAHAVERGFPADGGQATRSNKRRRLYDALADHLHAEYARWDPQARTRRRLPPVALTSTFDLELERALAAAGQVYEVALPVYVSIETRSTLQPEPRVDESVRWLVGRFGPRADPTLDDLRRPDGPWRMASSFQMAPGSALDLGGPLLLKVNGSPSHDLPRRKGDGTYDLDLPEVRAAALARAASESGSSGGHRSRFGAGIVTAGTTVGVELHHALAVGEYDFLQLSRLSQYAFDVVVHPPNDSTEVPAEDGLPSVLVEQLLAPERYWLLLGQRFADWSVRTQIHTFIAHEARQTERGCAVALDFDEDRMRFLDWLGITRAQGDLAELVRPLEDLARDVGER